MSRARGGADDHRTGGWTPAIGGLPWAYDHVPFTPAYVLPVQISMSSLGQIESPEKRLLAAVLMRALDDLRLARTTSLGGHQRRSRHRRASWLADVEEWFADHDGRWPFSFESTCAGLGIDADAIRKALRRSTHR